MPGYKMTLEGLQENHYTFQCNGKMQKFFVKYIVGRDRLSWLQVVEK